MRSPTIPRTLPSLSATRVPLEASSEITLKRRRICSDEVEYPSSAMRFARASTSSLWALLMIISSTILSLVLR